MKFGHQLAIGLAALAMAATWAEAQPAPAAKSKATAKPGAKAIDAHAAQATPLAASGPVDRREKATQTTSRVVKKTQDSASAVIGNTK